MSVPVTLSDLERRNVRGQNFPEDFLNYVPTVWPRMTKFAIKKHVRGRACGEAVFLRGQTRPRLTGCPRRKFLPPPYWQFDRGYWPKRTDERFGDRPPKDGSRSLQLSETRIEDPKRTLCQCTASVCIAGVHCWEISFV